MQPLELRVYYEDTDFSGRVYHGSYLRFLERGRTEWLRARGFEQRALAEQAELAFAVRSLQIEYLAPALMDDLITVSTRCVGARGALIAFEQIIERAERTLIRATVQVVTLRGGRPVRPPRALMGQRQDEKD